MNKNNLKILGQILGAASAVVGSWLATRAETGALTADAAKAAVAAAATRVTASEAQSASLAVKLATSQGQTERAHDVNADAINECLDALDGVEDEIDDLTREFDRLAGAVEAFHGQRRVAAAAERVQDQPPQNRKPRGPKVPAFQMLE